MFFSHFFRFKCFLHLPFSVFFSFISFFSIFSPIYLVWVEYPNPQPPPPSCLTPSQVCRLTFDGHSIIYSYLVIQRIKAPASRTTTNHCGRQISKMVINSRFAICDKTGSSFQKRKNGKRNRFEIQQDPVYQICSLCYLERLTMDI